MTLCLCDTRIVSRNIIFIIICILHIVIHIPYVSVIYYSKRIAEILYTPQTLQSQRHTALAHHIYIVRECFIELKIFVTTKSAALIQSTYEYTHMSFRKQS